MPFARRRLTRLEPHEVSLVPRGANLKKFLVHKSDEGGDDAADVLAAIIAKAAEPWRVPPKKEKGEAEEVETPPAAKGAAPPKVPPAPSKDKPDEEDDEAKEKARAAKAEAVKKAALDEDSLYLLELVVKNFGEDVVRLFEAGKDAPFEGEMTDDQRWVAERVEKAWGRRFGPPQRPVAPTAPPMHPDAAAAMQAPQAGPPQQQPVHVQQGPGTPPVSPAADVANPLGNQLPAQGLTMSAPAQGALKAVARILAPHKGEITADSVAEVLDAIGIPTGAAEEPQEEDENEEEAGPPAAPPANSAGQKLDGKPEYVALSMDSEPDRNEDAMPVQVDLSAFPPTQRAAMEQVVKSLEASAKETATELEKVNKSLADENSTLKKRLDDQEGERVLKQHIATAEQFDRLGAKPEQMGRILKTLHEKDPELGKELEAVLKGANEQLAMADELDGGLLAEQGSSQGGSRGGSAQAQLDALIDGHVQKAEAGQTRAQVAVKVQKSAEGRRLRKLIEKENADRVRRFGAA